MGRPKKQAFEHREDRFPPEYDVLPGRGRWRMRYRRVTPEFIRAIWALKANGDLTNNAIAELLNTSGQTVGQILKGTYKAWPAGMGRGPGKNPPGRPRKEATLDE